MSPKPVSRELAPAGTSAHSRLYVQVTSPKRTSGPRRYAVVSTPTCDLNRTGCSSGITCEMAISRQLLACRVGDIQLTLSTSGSFQLLSKTAFSGPYKRNHGNHF